MKKFLLSLVGLFAIGMSMNATDYTDNLTTDNFTGISYTAAKTYTSSTTKAVYTAQAYSNKGFQIRSSKSGTGFTVKTAPEGYTIKSVTITFSTKGSNFNFYISNSALSLSSLPSTATKTLESTTQTISDINQPYFALNAAGDELFVISKISVVWTDELSQSGPDIIFTPGNGSTLYADEKVTISTSKENSPVNYQINNGDVLSGQSPISISFNADGEYSIKAWTESEDKSVTAKYTYSLERPLLDVYNFAQIYGSSNSTPITEVKVSGFISNLSFTHGGTNTGYFSTNNDLRLYGGGSMTISVPEDYYITKIESTFKNTSNKLTADHGTLTTDYKTWTNAETVNNITSYVEYSSIKFSESGTSGNRSWTELTVHYAKREAKTPSQLSFGEQTEYSVREDQDFTMPTLSNPLGIAYTLHSSNTDAADFDNGELVILYPGKTIISAIPVESKYEGIASFNLEVTPKPELGNLKVNDVEVAEKDDVVYAYTNEDVTFSAAFADKMIITIMDSEAETILYKNLDKETAATYVWTPTETGEYTVEITVSREDVTKSYCFDVIVTDAPKLQTVAKYATFDFTVADAYGITTTSESNTYQKSSTSFTENGVTMSIVYVDGNGCRIWDASGTYDLRIYPSSNYYTLTAPEGTTITKVSYTGSATNGTPGNGEFANKTWTPKENESVTTLKVVATSQLKISTITVEYSKVIEAPEDYTVSINDALKTELPSELDIKEVKSHVIKITAPAGHHIYHKFVAKAAAASAPRKALSVNKDEYEHVESNEATITLDKVGTFTFFTEHPETGAYHEPATISVINSDTTGIAEVSADKAEVIYDLQGRKVSKGGRGLFIQGGKVVRL